MADLVELHAEDQALRKDFVESVLPSPSAPKLVSVYVIFAVARDDDTTASTAK